MLDLFTIFSKGGIVLWYFQGTSQLFTNSINELIKSVILQERGVTSAWNHNTLSLQYKLDNEFELVFVVAYQNIIKLTYIDKFLDEIQMKFRDRYKQVIQNGHLDHNFSDFRADFDNVLLSCEQEAAALSANRQPRRYEDSSKANRTVASMIETKKGGGLLSSLIGASPTETSSGKGKGKNKNSTSNKEKMNQNENEDTNKIEEVPSVESENFPSDNDDPAMSPRSLGRRGIPGRGPKKFENKKLASPKNDTQKQVKKGKVGTVWEEKIDVSKYDYSDTNGTGANGTASSAQNRTDENSEISKYATANDIGRMKGDLRGLEVAESNYGDDYDDDYEEAKSKKNQKKSSQQQQQQLNGNNGMKASNKPASGLFSSLKSLVGAKVLTKEAIEPVMEKMQDHLIGKNVAAEIAKKICDNVAQNLEGKQMSSFQFVTSIVKQALQESMIQILTPKKRVDILRDIVEAQRQKRPYVIVFCGVNGVGKSTNLAKVTFWLIENSHRVLIAACDTFRSGAVEQLRTHTRHLNNLHPPENHNGRQMVELFEKGYGKDAAGIANEAINYATDKKFDVVLVDTAGRMQDNEPLMKALAKLININNPDLVLFVGEALVGNEAVDQVRKFNQALIDNSSVRGTNVTELARTIDGIVLTKFDTIDDKMGAAISMTYTTGQPIVFVGTGQTYSDLKSLNAQSVVQSLLK